MSSEQVSEVKVVNKRTPKKKVIVDGAEVDDDSKRHQLTETIKVYVSTARLRHRLAESGVNADVKATQGRIESSNSVSELTPADVSSINMSLGLLSDSQKEETKESKKAVQELKNKATAIMAAPTNPLTKEDKKVLKSIVNKQNLRVSDDAIVAFASTADYIAVGLIRDGVSVLMSGIEKTLKLQHVLKDIETKDYYAFIRHLPSVKKALADELVRQNTPESAKQRKPRKNKADEKDTAVTSLPVVTPVKKDKKSKDSPLAFAHNIRDIAKHFLPPVQKPEKPKVEPAVEGQPVVEKPVEKVPKDKNAPPKNRNVSSEVSDFGSTVIYELCKQYVVAIRYQIEFAKIKTLKANIISTINPIIAIEQDYATSGMALYIAERMKLYMDHLEKVKVAKASEPKKTTEPVVEPPAAV